jgi:hypothetical protein
MANGSNALQAIAGELDELVKPLRVIITDPSPPHHLVRFLGSAGWTLPGLAEADLAALFAGLSEAADAVAALPDNISTDGLGDIATSLTTIGDAIGEIRGLVASFEDFVATVLGGSEHIAADLVEDVWQTLVVRWLAKRRPSTFRILRTVGVVTNDIAPPLSSDSGVPVRAGTNALRLRPANLPALISDPIGTLREIYAATPMTSPIEAQATALLVGSLTRPLIDSLGGQLGVFPPWGWQNELPAAERDRAARSIVLDIPLLSPEASAFRPAITLVIEMLSADNRGELGRSGPGAEISLQGLASMNASKGSVDLDLDVTATAGTVFVGPSTVVAQAGGAVDATATISLRSDGPMVLGADNGTRVEFGTPTMRTRVLLDGELDVEVELLLAGAALVVSMGDGDSFVASVLPSAEMRVEGDIGLVWSRQGGLRLSGSSDLTMRLPINLDILGLLVIEALQTSFEVTDSGFTIKLGIDGEFTLGPFTARIEGVGLRVLIRVDASGGNLGIADLAVEFQPPYRVEFEIDAGPVTGEGFVEYFEDTERYVGGLSLDVVAVGIDAFTIIDTSLPDDPNGFALFATLTLRFPSIPLGFGFSLSGLGGLLALNRCVDTEALALGLRDGAADAILFPENVLRDADLLVTQIDEYFPIMSGNTVVGPVAEIRWGVGDMLIGQIGVAISLPQGLILVLASIEAVLPDRVAPLIELHLDVLGVLDIEEGSLLIVGSLYDSRLLGVIELSGDTALYVSWLDDPYFVMSVGGFHPGFTPPAHVPAILEDLRRMRAEVSIGDAVTASIEAYFAVTSNTVQFGGGFEVEASAKFLLVTYTARGWFEFDVLLQFAPFLILADASAGVGVYANDKELLGVSLSVHLEGPQPWYASGNATFKFFGINVKFDFAVGGHAPSEARGSSDVLALVHSELNSPASWTAQHATTNSAGLRLAGGIADDLVRPDDVLVGRQTVAPFDRPIARFGETTPLQSEVSMSSARIVAVNDNIDGDEIGDLLVDDAFDWFAPAQFDVMADQSRLSSPSYEQMVAGVSIGGTGVAVAAEVPILAPEGHETEVWSPATSTTVKYTAVIADRPIEDMIAASSGAHAMSTTTVAATDLRRIDLGGQMYVAIDSTSGASLSDELPYSAAIAVAVARSAARVVPAHAGVSA